MANKDKKSEIIGVRVTQELRKKLESRAKKDERSLSQVVGIILSKALGSKKA